MIEKYHFPKCHLNIGRHKTIDSSVYLEVHTNTDDEYAEQTADNEEYPDGIKAIGELSFDIYSTCPSPVQKNTIGLLTFVDGGELSKCNILIAEKNCEKVIVKNRIKRHFWVFFVTGRPIYDGLEIFPDWYRGKEMNKVFICTNFRGIWPVGVSSLVVAKDRKFAKGLLLDALEKAGINQPEVHDLTLEEVNLAVSQALVLNKGEY